MTNRAKILLVDDVVAILDEEERILKQFSELEIFRAESGAEAVKKVASERPDVVFLDLMLPDLNGEQICRVIKSKPELEDTAVIIVTGRDDQEHLQRAFQAGCDAYVTKPFNGDDLVEKVRILLAEKGIMLGDDSATDDDTGT